VTILPVNVIDHLPPAALTRRRLLMAAGALGLSGCASDSLSLLGAAMPSFRSTARGNAYPISDAQIKAIPYASMGVQIGSAPPVVTILASVDGRRLSWASADRVVLITERGRLVKTIGLPRDLLTTRFTEFDPLERVRQGEKVPDRGVTRIVDLRPRDDFGVPVNSQFSAQGEESLTMLGETRTLLRIRERVVVAKWRWSTDNLYWIDPASGQIWRSRQQFCPDVPAITMEVLRPSARA